MPILRVAHSRPDQKEFLRERIRAVFLLVWLHFRHGARKRSIALIRALSAVFRARLRVIDLGAGCEGPPLSTSYGDPLLLSRDTPSTKRQTIAIERRWIVYGARRRLAIMGPNLVEYPLRTESERDGSGRF